MSGETQVGFVIVDGGVDLVEETYEFGVGAGEYGVDATGLLTVANPGNVLLDLGIVPGVKVVNGIRVVDNNGNVIPMNGPITLAAFTDGDPALFGLQFTHLDGATSAGDRCEGSHGLAVTIDAYQRPIQLFWRPKLDGGNGAWLVPDWSA